ncbi:tetratricopeptide repeat protein [Geminicoccus roseus]|uniref:tetratricopeptide repeat protein n=1 Tax=Geminicoccus roseus TaxID=404900 RepID=UPI0009FC6B2B|nr:tetratricopeptide repeat protein [Geminicoccus roseus]
MAWISGGCDPRRPLAVLRLPAVALALALLAAPPVLADQRDPALAPLFERLKRADAVEGPGIEDQIWAIWFRYPDRVVASLLDEGTVLMSRRRWAEALDRFDQIVARAPDFAEGWNKRATVRFLLDDLEGSVADIQRTLLLEPRHFGALAGLGQVYLRLERPAAALRAFQAALDLNPAMAGVRRQVEELRAWLDGSDI